MTSSEDRSQVWAMVARRVTLCAAALAVVLGLGVTVYGVVVIRDTQQSNVPKIDHTAEIVQIVQHLAVKIDSCTDPQGTCARRGQRATAGAVADISVRQVAAVACADQPGTQSVSEIKACVARTVRVLAAAEGGD